MKTPNEIQSYNAEKSRVDSFRDARSNSDARSNRPNRPDGDSDVVSFWLLLLFIATFFGIAAEEARRPSMFQSAGISSGHSSPLPIAYSVDGTPLPNGAGDQRANMARRFDLSSVDPETASRNVPGKLEIPATGK